MPVIIVRTNTSFPADILASTTAAVSKWGAQETGKPEKYVMAMVDTHTSFLFGGTTEPAAFVEVKSIGLQQDRLPELSQSLCQLLSKTLSIPPNRTYIEFTAPEGSWWGWDGSTF